MITDNKEVIIMSEVTSPIMTDATGQSIDSKLNSLLGKMDNLAAAFQPNASGIVYSNTTSGLTGDDVQEAIDEMAADVSEIKQSLSQLVIHHDTLSGTTDNSGRLFSNYDISNKLIIALLPTEHGKIADQVRLTGNTLCIKYLNSDSMSPYNNQSVTCNFYYVSADLIVEDN